MASFPLITSKEVTKVASQLQTILWEPYEIKFTDMMRVLADLFSASTSIFRSWPSI